MGENETKIIDANQRSLFPNFRELMQYKDLFLTLAWRDFRVRYAQTTIGFLWAFLQPILTLLILSLVFGRLVGIPTPVPYLLFAMTGISLWSYFSFVLSNSGASIISSQDMVKKIYFPRLVIPLSKAAVGLIDLAISLLMLIVLMFYYGIAPSVNFWLAPFFILAALLAALSIGIWLSALTVRFRDFQHIVPFMVQIGLYVTPIAYPADFAMEKLPKWATSIYYLNPMAGIIQGFRWSLFGGTPPDGMAFISFGMVVLFLVSGLMYFRKVEDEMADFV